MTFSDIKKYFGTIQIASQHLFYTTAAIYSWERKKGIPLRTQRNIQALTNGKLKADKK